MFDESMYIPSVRLISTKFINKAVDMVKLSGQEDFYLNFSKLHSLMFIAQCYSWVEWDKPLFRGDAIVRPDGINIDGLCGFTSNSFGDDYFKYKVNESRYGTSTSLNDVQDSIIESVLLMYGRRSAMELAWMTKATRSWQNNKQYINDLKEQVVNYSYLVMDGEEFAAEINTGIDDIDASWLHIPNYTFWDRALEQFRNKNGDSV